MGPGAARLPPTLGQLSVAALTAATHVLIPVEATIGASRALPQILKTVESIRARGSTLAWRLSGSRWSVSSRRDTHGSGGTSWPAFRRSLVGLGRRGRQPIRTA